MNGTVRSPGVDSHSRDKSGTAVTQVIPFVVKEAE